VVVELVGEAVVTVLVEGACVVVLLAVEVLSTGEVFAVIETVSLDVLPTDEASVKVLVEGACVVVLLVTEVIVAVELIPAVVPV
jgi:hypothetical protein